MTKENMAVAPWGVLKKREIPAASCQIRFNVPEGQISQKKSPWRKYGTRMTRIAKRGILAQPLQVGTLYFGVGNFANKSWIKPKGQSQPQAQVPSNAPKKTSIAKAAATEPMILALIIPNIPMESMTTPR